MKAIILFVAAFSCVFIFMVSCKSTGGDGISPLLLMGMGSSDNSPPSVTSINPKDHAVEVAPGSSIAVTFNEDMNDLTITDSSFTVQEGINPPIAGSFYYTGTTATFDPEADLAAGKLYTITLTTDITDAAGNPLAAVYTWSFSTLPDHGYRDATFGGDGTVTTDINSDNNGIFDLAIQSDGKIVAAGYAESGDKKLFALARYNADGTLDTGFSSDGIVTTDMGDLSDGATGVAIQSDGKIIAVNQAWGASGYMNFAIARYEADGDLDTTFDGDGKMYIAFSADKNCYAKDVAIDSLGNIVIVGHELTGSGNMNIAVARLTSAGALDTTFSADGKVVTQISAADEDACAVDIQSDRKIVVAGYAAISGSEYFALLRYNTDGTLDLDFDTDGIVTTVVGTGNRRASSVKVISGGSILAGGGVGNFSLVKYTPAGSLDTSFDTDGMVVTDLGGSDTGTCLAVESDGSILFGGITSGTSNDFALVRYTPAGSIDTSFGVDGIVITDISGYDDAAKAIAVQTDGDIVLAGWAGNSTNIDFALARYIK